MAFTPSVVSRQPKYTITPITNGHEASTSRDTASGKAAIVSSRSKYYISGAVLDNRENRNVEFKAAQGSYIYDILPQAVEKYGCAFANGDGGTLYLGIRDDGFIIGVYVTEQDKARVLRIIQRAFDRFLPRPPSHTVRFIPLCSPNGVRIYANYKVIEISVIGGTLANIYETGSHKVFIKRDGSIELQNALQIKDLAITKYKQMLQQRS